MKVLIVAGKSELGGAPRSMMEMVRLIKEEYGVEFVVLLHNEGNLSNFCRENGIEYIVDGHEPVALSRGSTGIRRFAKFILRPYYFFHMIASNTKAVKIASRQLDIKEFDLIHTNSNRDGIGAILARKFHKDHIWHFREFGKEDYDVFYFPPFSINYINTFTTKFVMISKALEDSWVKKGLDESKCCQIYNGVNVDNIVVKDTCAGHDVVKIAFTGTVCPAKGQIEIIEALGKLKREFKDKVQVDFIGDGPKDYINQLAKRCAELNISNKVRFLGNCNNVGEILKNYDVGIVCSRSEAFGRITPEYMAAGLIVIGSNTGANPELIEVGKNGYIYEYGNTDELAAIIEQVCNLDDESWLKMSQYALCTSVKLYSDRVNARNIYNLYREVSSRK